MSMNHEAQIQRAVWQQFLLRRRPDVEGWHTPNGGWRNKVTAANLQKMGVVPGVSDLVFLWHEEGRLRFGALELKAVGGRMTEAQYEWQERIRNISPHTYTVVAEGVDRAVAAMECWGVIR